MTRELKYPALWILLLLIGFPQISETIYSPALPNIAHDLMANNTWVQWTLSVYFIGFALGVFLWGWVSDHIGRKRAMLMGLLLYCVASILCLKAGSISELLLFRGVRGLGASCGSVITQAMARESLPEQQRHQFFSMSGFILALAITLGPFVGGYLTQWFDWRANFVALVMMGVSLLLLSTFKLPETLRSPSVVKAQSFAAIARRMMTDKHILISGWIVGAVNGILFSYYAEGPFIFIRIIKLTPSEFGWLGFFIALAALLGTLVSRRLVNIYSPGKIMRMGIAVLLVSALIFVVIALFVPISAHHPFLSVALMILPMMGLIFAAFGFLVPITLSMALLNYQAVLGRAGALFGLGYYILVSLFTGCMGLIHNEHVWPMPVYFLVLGLSIAMLSRWGRAFGPIQS